MQSRLFYSGIFVVMFAVVGLLQAQPVEAFSGSGAGTSGDPYLISTCAQLASIASSRGSYYALSQDVDCDVAPYNDSESGGFAPIGQDGDSDFHGTLDGRGHAITGLLISSSSQNAGLFGYTEGATIKDIALTGIYSSGPYVVGSLVGVAASNTKIENVYVTGTVQSGNTDSYVGGLVGNTINSSVKNSYSTATVVGGRSGGLVGWGDGTVESSFSTGAVTGSVYTGGIMGGAPGTVVLGNVFSVIDPVLGFSTGSADLNRTGLSDGEADFYQGDTFDVYDNSDFSEWDFDTVWKFNDASSLPVFRPFVAATTSTTFTNAENGKDVTLQTPVGTNITCSSVSKESANTAQDTGYSYPLGLVDFCFTTGSSNNQVTLVFVTDLKPDQVVVRKYDPSGHAYATVSGAVVTETVSGGKHALQVVYTIADNGPLDTNPAVGAISDPVGLAVANVPGAPNTGVSPRADYGLFLLGLLGVGILLGAGVLRQLAHQIRR